jgi:hypothetical protein
MEEISFVSKGFLDCFASLDIPLSSVDDRDISETERDDSPCEDINNVGSLVHQVDFCEDTNGATPLWIDFPRQFQTIRVCEICVTGCDGENDGIWFGDVLENHISDLSLNILWLISNRDLCEPREIDEGECEDIWGEDSQVDGDW